MVNVKVSAIANVDDATIFWQIDNKIPGCWGFAIERERKTEGAVERKVLDNRAGFEKDKPKAGETRLSTEWPFQRFNWVDHSANKDDTVRYRVTPVIEADGELAQDVSSQSSWSKWVTLTAEAGDGYSAYFNRGLVISQFMSRYLEKLRQDNNLETLEDALKIFKNSLDDHELPIRKFLGGDLREKILELLAEAKRSKHHVYGALYELEDEELVEALGALGKRGHIVLANGSIAPKKGVPAKDRRKEDQNKKARKYLREKKLEIFDRMLSPGALGHNKFLVVTTEQRKPISAWTGSTNWTKTGLCTQINNGLLVKNASFAKEYLDQWDRLRDAESAFPPDLVDYNTDEKVITTNKSKARVWFTKTRGKVDLQALEDIIANAKESIMFLMFQPGGKGPLSSISNRVGEKDLYVKGVVSTLPKTKVEGDEEEEEVTVTTVGDGQTMKPLTIDIVQPEGFKTPFANWARTVTRADFLYGKNKVGFAIVHSKVIVIDQFGKKPRVITGSHNFSGAASTKNDENFVIVESHPELALHYAGHILSVYQHYRWLKVVYDRQRRYLRANSPLITEDRWQDRHLKGAPKYEMNVWADNT